MEIRKEDLYKIKKIGFEDREVVGFISKVVDNNSNALHGYFVHTTTGEMIGLYNPSSVKSIKKTRNVPANLRDLLDKKIKLIKEENKMGDSYRKFMEDHKKKAAKLILESSNISISLQKEHFKAYGIYPHVEFVDKIETFTRSLVKDNISHNVNVSSYQDVLRVEIPLFSRKWADLMDFPIMYREYDDNYFIISDEEIVETFVRKFYKKDLDKLRKELGKKANISLTADVGDKRTIVLYVKVEIPYKERTKEELERIKEILREV